MAQMTAVQDLINELKQFKKFPMVNQPTIEAAIEFAELRLEMEKEQIEKAWNDHRYNKWGNENTIVNGEHYYKETYKQNT